MAFWRTAEFKALSVRWYERLRRDGFADVEIEHGGLSYLRKYSMGACEVNAAVREGREAYFLALARCVAYQPFDREVDRYVMSRKAEGISHRRISRELRERSMRPSHRLTVMTIVRRYEHRWGIRTWSPEKLDRNYKQNRR